MNVLHLSKFYHPDNGGIESVCRVLAEGAHRAGYSVSVVAFGRSKSHSEMKDNGLKIFRYFSRISLFSQPLSLRYFMRAVFQSRRVDLVHLHFPNFLAALCIVFVPRRVKVVTHWHSDVLGRAFLVWLLRWLVRWVLRRSDSIVATSPIYAAHSDMLAPFLDRVSVIPIGIDAPPSSAPSELPADVAYRLNGKRVILSVGRLVPYKGFRYLVEASSLLPDDCVVVVVGKGPCKEVLETQICCSGLHENFFLVGEVSVQELHSLYCRADIFCLPSITRAEAFGVVLLEAMSFGLPIVATDIIGSGVSWVNQHGVTGLNVAPGDSVSLSKAILECLGSSGRMDRISFASRNRFEVEFTAELSVRRFVLLYEDLLGREEA